MIFARPYKFLRNGGYTRSSNKKRGVYLFGKHNAKNGGCAVALPLRS